MVWSSSPRATAGSVGRSFLRRGLCLGWRDCPPPPQPPAGAGAGRGGGEAQGARFPCPEKTVSHTGEQIRCPSQSQWSSSLRLQAQRSGSRNVGQTSQAGSQARCCRGAARPVPCPQNLSSCACALPARAQGRGRTVQNHSHSKTSLREVGTSPVTRVLGPGRRPHPGLCPGGDGDRARLALFLKPLHAGSERGGDRTEELRRGRR